MDPLQRRLWQILGGQARKWVWLEVKFLKLIAIETSGGGWPGLTSLFVDAGKSTEAVVR